MAYFSKILKYTVLLAAVFYWAVAVFKSMYHFAADKNLFDDSYSYGDLYRLSLLPQFKEATGPCAFPKVSKNDNINLHLVGDSFCNNGKLKAENFAADSAVVHNWAFPAAIPALPKNKKNILIIESVERSLGLRFNKVEKGLSIQNKSVNAAEGALNEGFWEYYEKNNKGIDERLAYTVFYYPFFRKLKEYKAWLELTLFGRSNSNVVVSKNGQHIFYADEADSSRSSSSFYPIDDATINEIVDHLNATATYYKSIGFDQVYLSLIPNKVSILEPKRHQYNRNLEKIVRHPKLQIPTIDVFSAFSLEPEKIYYKSDTHWNCYGQGLWLQKVNESLAKAAGTPTSSN